MSQKKTIIRPCTFRFANILPSQQEHRLDTVCKIIEMGFLPIRLIY